MILPFKTARGPINYGRGGGEAMIVVRKPGVQATIQDLGRYGYQALGFASGGAVDALAYRWANALVGNAPEAAAIEIVLQGGEWSFEESTWVAVTGAVCEVVVNDKERLPAWSAFWVQAGSTVRLGKFTGVYAYLAVRGGCAVPTVMGSRSTDLVAGIGGYAGRALQAGDKIPVGSTALDDWAYRRMLRRAPMLCQDILAPVRLLAGPHDEVMGENLWTKFFSQEFVVGADSNRMGIRLQGTFRPDPLAPMISEGMAPGAVQITPDGTALVLLPARGTLGGYPVVAMVATVDLGRLAQLKPGRKVRFERVSRETSRQLWEQAVLAIHDRNVREEDRED